MLIKLFILILCGSIVGVITTRIGLAVIEYRKKAAANEKIVAEAVEDFEEICKAASERECKRIAKIALKKFPDRYF